MYTTTKGEGFQFNISLPNQTAGVNVIAYNGDFAKGLYPAIVNAVRIAFARHNLDLGYISEVTEVDVKQDLTIGSWSDWNIVYFDTKTKREEEIRIVINRTF